MLQRLTPKLFAPVLSAILLGLLMLGFTYGPSLFEASWLTRARTAHAEWIASARLANGEVLDTKSYLSGLRQMGQVPHLPDLTGAGLRIALVSYIAPAQDRPRAIHVGYEDLAGCDISLLIAKTPEAGHGALNGHGDGAYSWRADGLRYVLLSGEMEYDRLHLIAKTAHAATLARRAPQGTAYAALGFSTMISKPCKA